MTDKQIQHTIEMYHRKAMREPTKRVAYDQLMADRIASIWPEEAIAIWDRIIQNSTDAWQGDYDNIVRALKSMKSILFILGRAKEFRARVRSIIESNKRRRNLVDALEEL